MNVDFIPIKVPDNSTKLTVVCPECTEPNKLSQRYFCDDPEHGPYSLNEAARAREIDKVLYLISEEEIAALKTPELPAEAGLALQPFSAVDVAAHTIPNGTSYRLRPRSSLAIYAMLTQLAADPNRAYIGEVNLRNSQKLFRVQSWNGQMLAVELARPDELAPVDEFDNTYDERLLATAEALLADVQPFDPEAFRNVVRERAAALDESKRDPNAVPVSNPKPVQVEVNDLLSQLQAAVSATTKPKSKKKVKA